MLVVLRLEEARKLSVDRQDLVAGAKCIVGMVLVALWAKHELGEAKPGKSKKANAVVQAERRRGLCLWTSRSKSLVAVREMLRLAYLSRRTASLFSRLFDLHAGLIRWRKSGQGKGEEGGMGNFNRTTANSSFHQ